MRKLSREKRVQVISCLVEGCSIRSTVRMTGAAKNTVTKLLVDIGMICGEYQYENLVDLPCKRIQADEIWSFCHAKDKNLPDHMKYEEGVGSIWTWTAICADTKLAVSWMVGKRTASWAIAFMEDVADRLRSRIQLSTDGLASYLMAVPYAFGDDIDYATVHKIYGRDHDQSHRYNPPQCIGIEKRGRIGRPRDQLRRAAKPHHANEHEAVYPAYQRLLKEAA